ncbi:MAG: hypothetical protein H6622_13990 [Halobacteriovoraceae bacterium]|nr:hypothetical protein [Halobacteriovoraceae bacterium]
MKYIIILIYLFYSSCFGAALEDLLDKKNLPEKASIIIVVGTFDPVHDRHIEINRGAIEQTDADYLIVLANDRTLHKPFTSTHIERNNMLFEAYKNDEKILVPRNYDFFGPSITTQVLKFLKTVFKEVQIHGLIGQGDVNNFKNRVASHFFKVDKWYVSSVLPLDQVQIPDTFGGVPTVGLYIPTVAGDPHSTEIREWFKNNQKIFELPEKLPISKEVFDFIKKQGLYLKEKNFKNGSIGFWRCLKIMSKGMTRN